MVRSYELSLVISPEIADDRVEAIKDQLKTYVTDRGGEITNEDNLGRKKLAYRIDKFTEGNYYVIQFDLEAASAKQLENTLNLSEEVIRYLLLTKKVMVSSD